MLGEEIRSTLRRAPGRVGVVVEDAEGLVLDVEGSRVVPAASTIKVLLLVCALGRVAEGLWGLDQPFTLSRERVGGAGALDMLPSVGELSLDELLHLMIALSDNDATNAVIDRLDAGEVAARAAALGLGNTCLQRRMMDQAAREAGRENLTSARDLARLMVLLRAGEALPPEQTAYALRVLARQQDRDGLPAALPPGVWCGNKTGELHGIRHDVALRERDGHWAAVAVTATDLDDGDVDRGAAVRPSCAAIGEAVSAWLSGTGRTGARPGPHRP